LMDVYAKRWADMMNKDEKTARDTKTTFILQYPGSFVSFYG